MARKRSRKKSRKKDQDWVEELRKVNPTSDKPFNLSEAIDRVLKLRNR